MSRLAGLAVAAAIATGSVPGWATAQEWVAGLGVADFSFDGSSDGSIVALEYHHRPFYRSGMLSLGWGASAVVHSTGDAFVGLGLVGRYDFDSRWFAEASVMPGAFFESLSADDLGSTFEVRSLLGLGYRIDKRNAVSLAVTHKSNGGASGFNPGVNSVLLRWHRRF